VKDTIAIAAVFAALFTCAVLSRAPLEAMADPADAAYIPRPEWYFLGLFQLLKYFPGKLEPVGAIGIPALIVALLFLLPLFDPEPERDPRARPRVSAIVTLVVFAVSTLTWLGFRDTPKEQDAAVWGPRAVAGQDLVSSGKCTRCHATGGAGPDLARGRINRDDQWVLGHASDPDMIAPGLRPPPSTGLSGTEARAVVAYVKKIREAAPPPQIAPEMRVALDVFGSKCIACHLVDGDGGKAGPDLTHAAHKAGHDAAWFVRWISDPAAVDPNADMPAFAGKLSDVQMNAIAQYLARRQ
jgi:ubiquinol-cytochrome c reductase cytochrome b subunit